MGADRLERRRLADDGAVWSQRGRFSEIARARHARLFIGGRQDVERFFQLRHIHVTQRIKNKREKAFHIGGAEPEQFVVMLGQRERVARPAPVVERHGIGMPGQQQAARATAGARQHIEFIARTGDRLYFDLEAETAKPARQQID